MDQPGDTFDHVLLSTVFSGIGFSMLLGVFMGMRKSKESRQWPAASGKITESATQGSFEQTGRGGMWIERPKLSYTYTVDSKEYEGHSIGVAEMGSASKQDAQEKIAPYPVGKEVMVFYNPRNPDEAILEKQSGANTFVFLGIVGTILLTIGILIWFNVIRF